MVCIIPANLCLFCHAAVRIHWVLPAELMAAVILSEYMLWRWGTGRDVCTIQTMHKIGKNSLCCEHSFKGMNSFLFGVRDWTFHKSAAVHWKNMVYLEVRMAEVFKCPSCVLAISFLWCERKLHCWSVQYGQRLKVWPPSHLKVIISLFGQQALMLVPSFIPKSFDCTCIVNHNTQPKLKLKLQWTFVVFRRSSPFVNLRKLPGFFPRYPSAFHN